MNNELQPTTPLDIRDGHIHYSLYNQEGVLQPCKCADTVSNRLFVVWVRKFDRR